MENFSYTDILPPGGNGLWTISYINCLPHGTLVACLLVRDFVRLSFTFYARKKNMT